MAKAPEQDASVTTANRVEKARQFYNEATAEAGARTKADRASSWGQLWLIKKRAKYGWDRLGFTPREVERIRINKPDWV